MLYYIASATKYDEIIVIGSLTIKSNNFSVFLITDTIIIESKGLLDIESEYDSLYTIIIEIDDNVDVFKDPQQTMIGIIALEGRLIVKGK